MLFCSCCINSVSILGSFYLGEVDFRFFDQKSSLDFSWLDTVRPTMQVIPCGL